MNLKSECADVFVEHKISPKNRKYFWSTHIYDGNTLIRRKSGRLTGKALKPMEVIGCHIRGIREAVNFAKVHNFNCRIHYNFDALYDWVADLWNGKRLHTNISGAKSYRAFIKANILNIDGFRRFSEKVDTK